MTDVAPEMDVEALVATVQRALTDQYEDALNPCYPTAGWNALARLHSLLLRAEGRIAELEATLTGVVDGGEAWQIRAEAAEAALLRAEEVEASIRFCPCCATGFIPNPGDEHKDSCPGCARALRAEEERGLREEQLRSADEVEVSLRARLLRAEGEREELRKALEFYADEKTWTQMTSWGGRIIDNEGPWLTDCGRRAVEALTTPEETKEKL